MNTRTTATRLTVVAALGAGMLLAAPTAAVYAAEDTPVCEVTDGTMNWGVLERWRAYISGNIAAGGWEAIDGATYETPEFGWSNATGEIDPETGAGTISFTGGVHFTGHDGALDTTFANPTIVIDESGNGTLLLDVQSLGRDGGADTNEEQVEMGDLGAVGTIDAASGSFSLDAAPVTLSEAGSAVFTAYEPGQPMDPITLDVQIGECVGDEPVAEEPADEEETTEAEVTEAPAAEAEENSVPWLPIGIVGGVVVLAAIVGGVVASKRKKASAGGEEVASD